MTRHIVLMKFGASPDAAAVSRVLGAFEELGAALPEVMACSTGENTSPEGLGRGFTHTAVLDFQTAAARDAYLAHPEHVRAAEQTILPGLPEGIDSIAVCDYEITDAKHEAIQRSP